MDEIKHFIDVVVPVSSCTLRCSYCYVTHHRLFDSKLPTYPFSVETWRKALEPKRWGGVCLLNFCAMGETLLSPELIDYIRVSLELGHYVMVVTNATVDKAIQKMAAFDKELLERLFFKFSFHHQQLTERNLVDRFFRNVRTMRDAGASFTVEVTPHDELIPQIESIKELVYREVGAWPHITVARDERDMAGLPLLTRLSKQEYKQTWGVFDSALFDFKIHIYGEKRREFCYAGQWLHYLSMTTGRLHPCYNQPYSQDILSDPTCKIHFHPVGHFCRQPHCFNGHTWLGLGAIPSVVGPTYTEMRNRNCADGTEWLQPKMKSAMETKLWKNHPTLPFWEKLKADAFVFCMLVRNKIISMK